MKRALTVLFVLIFSVLYSSDFEKKAQAASAALASAQAELSKIRGEFDRQSPAIQRLKVKKDFISQFLLKRSLSKANRLAYRANFLQAESESITNDLITYSFILVDAHSQELKKCIKEGCAELEKIKADREIHLNIILKHGSLAAEEQADPGMLALKEKNAALDVIDELEKKIIRLEQRIFILEEERGIMSALNDNQKADEINELIKKMKTAMKNLRRSISRHSEKLP